jgi:hypothetical protein
LAFASAVALFVGKAPTMKSFKKKKFFVASAETIRKAPCRDSYWRANGPLGAALDLLLERR